MDDRTQEAIQRITTENTTLKQRVRQLTQDNRTLEEQLKAARSNLRFQTVGSPTSKHNWPPSHPLPVGMVMLPHPILTCARHPRSPLSSCRDRPPLARGRGR